MGETATEPKAKRRWYVPTPRKLVLGLLVVELCLLLIGPGSGSMVFLGVAIFLSVVFVGLLWLLGALIFRRLFQFGFVSLLALMCVVVILGGWFSWKMRKAQRQQQAVTAIRKWLAPSPAWPSRSQQLRVYIVYDYQFNANPGVTEPGPAWFRSLVGLDFLADVIQVQLGTVGISDTTISDPVLEHLEGLTELKHLHFHMQVSDSELEHLKGLTSLEGLSLDNTQITDAGLKHLRGLTNLKSLYLSNAQVTDEGLAELQQALPNCQINHD